MSSSRLPARWLAVVCLALVWLGAPAARTQPRHILVLLSFDGWRADYTSRFQTPNLHALAARGAYADALVPSFPTLTFPNHYTIVTGLYPDHHGIVGNTMVDVAIPQRFSLSADMATTGAWWGGEPLWVTAQKQGLTSATMFWPGSEAPIGGVFPTQFMKFDDSVTNDGRVKQVLDWISLPEDKRPSLVTAYFSEVDHAGHDFGPNSPQVREAATHLDAALGRLVDGIRGLHMLDQTNLVVVSDHGMTEISTEREIFLDDYVDPATVDVIEWQPLMVAPRVAGPAAAEDLYRRLHGRNPALTIYRNSELPARLHFGTNPRVPHVVGLSNDGWTVTTHERSVRRLRAGGSPTAGQHGFDNQYQSMQALFVAAGPGLRQGGHLARLENIHLYDLLCHLLGVRPAPNDGNPAATRSLLSRPS